MSVKVCCGFDRWLRIGLMVALIAGLVVGVAWGPAAAAEKLRVGEVYVWLGDIPLYVAETKGFYKQRGLDVDLIAFKGGGELASALVGGSVDIAIGAVDHAMKMKEKGLDVAVVLVIQEKLGFTMMAGKGSGVKSVKDLKGKVLATSAPGSSADNYMRYLVVTAGLDHRKDVTIVAVGGPARIVALKQGSAAAAAVTEPSTTTILEEGIGEILHRGTEWDYPFNVAIVKKDFLKKNRAAVQAFVEATLEAARYARANPNEAAAIGVEKFSKSDPKIIRQAVLNYLPTFSETGVLSEETMAFVSKILMTAGVLKEPVTAASLADPELPPRPAGATRK